MGGELVGSWKIVARGRYCSTLHSNMREHEGTWPSCTYAIIHNARHMISVISPLHSLFLSQVTSGECTHAYTNVSGKFFDVERDGAVPGREQLVTGGWGARINK